MFSFLFVTLEAYELYLYSCCAILSISLLYTQFFISALTVFIRNILWIERIKYRFGERVIT